jgi:hypothetical protein
MLHWRVRFPICAHFPMPAPKFSAHSGVSCYRAFHTGFLSKARLAPFRRGRPRPATLPGVRKRAAPLIACWSSEYSPAPLFPRTTNSPRSDGAPPPSIRRPPSNLPGRFATPIRLAPCPPHPKPPPLRHRRNRQVLERRRRNPQVMDRGRVELKFPRGLHQPKAHAFGSVTVFLNNKSPEFNECLRPWKRQPAASLHRAAAF